MSADLPRCHWCGNDPLYVAYHDEEWGKPLHDEQLLFEHLCLEGFQCGLSWITILRKRENFREAFRNFDLNYVAALTDADIDTLCTNPGIIRNRSKIRSTINNAQRVLALHKDHTSLDELLWSFAPDTPQKRPRDPSDLPTTSPESHALARTLKKRAFTFVGPTGMYALMQAVGIVDDHLESCFLAHSEP